MTKLIMFTKTFPYGTGEAFIESEIPTLGRKFEKVLIIATEVTPNIKTERDLPDNFIVMKVSSHSLGRQKAFDVLSGLFSRRRSAEFKAECKNVHGVVQTVFLKYFEAKSQRIFHLILKNEKWIALKEQFDDAIYYSYWLFSTARVAGLLRPDERNLLLSRAHGYDLYENVNKLNYLPFREYFLNTFDYIFPCSDFGERYLTVRYPKATAVVRRAWLGTKDYGETTPDVSTFSIVSCSRLVPLKRVHMIIETLSLFDSVKIKWTHIGGGKLQSELMKQAHQKLSNIDWTFTGNVSNEEVLSVYKSNHFDLFLNVSSSEGLPVSIMEAQSFGIPAVATDVGGTSEIIKTGLNGSVIPPDFKISDLKAEIWKYFQLKGNDKLSYDKIRKASRNNWLENFESNHNYGTFWDNVISANEIRRKSR